MRIAPTDPLSGRRVNAPSRPAGTPAAHLGDFAGGAPRRVRNDRQPRPAPPVNLPPLPQNIGSIPNAVPQFEPRAPHGNPPFYDVDGRRYYVLASAEGYDATGVASWYGPTFDGLRTSDGDRYDMYAMTAAHKTLPLPCYVRVTNLSNGRSIVVKVNDRGPAWPTAESTYRRAAAEPICSGPVLRSSKCKPSRLRAPSCSTGRREPAPDAVRAGRRVRGRAATRTRGSAAAGGGLAGGSSSAGP